MKSESFDIRARADMYNGGFEVAVFKGDAILQQLTFVDLPQHGLLVEPTLSGREGLDFLQAALNCAWELGLRPVGHHHTAEAIAAKDHHLADMRAIAFAKLNVEKP